MLYNSIHISPLKQQPTDKYISCLVKLRLTKESIYHFEMCENSSTCQLLCTDIFKISNVLLGTFYDIKVHVSSYYNDIEFIGRRTRNSNFK